MGNKREEKLNQSFEASGVPELDERERFKYYSALLSQVDGILTMGGDGTFSEVVHGLLLRARHQLGLPDEAHRAHSLEIQPNLPIGLAPLSHLPHLFFS